MANYSLPVYDDLRTWIKRSRARGDEWEKILRANRNSDDEIEHFLMQQMDTNFWPEISVDGWKEIVTLEKVAEENTKNIEILAGIAQIHDEGQDNAIKVPMDPTSSWQLYRKKLLEDGFKKETVDEIENTTKSILRRLNNDTTKTGPIKGLVIGNVQSGKTANMAALMAMAADWGWNMFVVLSGTIDNLRIQTQNRLFSDLNQQGTIWWRSLEHLSKSVDISQKAQNLHFDPASKERYFTVCLKNSSRLSKLIQWMQADINKQRQMKILVIDDEADQAGINTGHVDDESEERKKINKLICALVNGQDENGKDISSQYLAMNYIGYTATPYANILNEAGEDSLYPKNFITTLAVSKEYFGPQQIFGYLGDNVQYEGMDIVRVILEDQLNELKNIHDGKGAIIPKSLIDAVCWFLCGVSCMRIWKYSKSISMLVHTSQKTVHHSQIADVITRWLDATPRKDIIAQIYEVWKVESSRFTLGKFREEYPDYDRPNEDINDYPSFELIEKEIETILGDGISHIELGDDGDLTYHNGIHLCIDNCTNNGITSDGMHVRLAYPESNKMPVPAPAFIVIGGATLSRGLTLDGLISTYFLRSVGQADTLMQMGRWFGYRKKYELLPRLWVTNKTRAQFEFLAALDQELRDEIQYMSINRRSPFEYGPKVKNSPKVSFIRVTDKKKMQSAENSTMDYSGASNQTYLFDNNAEKLERNIRTTEEFLAKLGKEWTRSEKLSYYKDTVIWKDIVFAKVREYIEKFEFQERLGVFNDTKPLLDWIETISDEGKLGNWNIVVAGKSNDTNGVWELPNGSVINKVRRSRKTPQNESEESVINIGVLREPRDLLADIDLDAIQDEIQKKEVAQYIKSGISKAAMAIRDKANLETTPQLLIYRVAKDSKRQVQEELVSI